MASYTYLKARDDGNFDHVSVDCDTGEETTFALVLAEDEQYPWGRPSDEEEAAQKRQQRDFLLQQTDVWVLPDRSPTQAQLDYRQALRDITTHDNWPHLNDDDWPVKPT